MLRHRTTARGVFLLLVLGLAAGSAAAVPDPPLKRVVREAVKNEKGIIFPVVGPARLTNSFGDARAQGAHQGEDIMAPRRALAVAAEAGKVRFHKTSWAAGCMLYLYGVSGTKYLYVHLNNDRGSGNDNRGKCMPGTAYAPGLKSGQRVEAGELVGYVGDSGDANGIHPHLHFEIHPGGGGAVAPYPYLRKARKLLFHVPRGKTFTLALSGKVVSAAGDGQALRVKVNVLRTFPRRQTISQLGRTLMLSVPETALVERISRIGAIGYTQVASARKDERVAVWTAPAAATLEAQLGRDGALSAERVQLLPTR